MNGTAVSEMSHHEQDHAEESPALRKFREAMGASRFSRLMATYVLMDELDANLCEEEETLRRFAKAAGTSPEAMQADLRWARAIAESDLRGAFAAEAIADLEWSERITLEHLRTIARAVYPDGGPLTSEERARWLVSAYHADETSAEFKDHLRKAGLLKARQPKALPAEEEERLIMEGRSMISQLVDLLSGDRGQNVAKKVRASFQRRMKVLGDTLDRPETAGALLIAAGQALMESDQDIDISETMGRRRPDKPFQAVALLEFLLGEYRTKRAGATFTLGTTEGGKADA